MSQALPRPAASRARVAGPALAAGALALALSGCGANFQAQTYQERSTSVGNNSAVGAIAIRNIAIVPSSDGTVAKGSDADVQMTLANDGADDDRLVSATSPAASSVDIVDRRTGTASPDLTVPRLGTTGSTSGLILRSVSSELRSGQTVDLTLRFERNGEVTVTLPVAVTGEFDSTREKSEHFQEPGESGEQASPSAPAAEGTGGG